MRSFYTWSCLFCILGVTFCKLTFRVREKVEILRELRITCVGVGRIAVGRDTCIKGLKKKWKNEHNAKYRSNHIEQSPQWESIKESGRLEQTFLRGNRKSLDLSIALFNYPIDSPAKVSELKNLPHRKNKPKNNNRHAVQLITERRETTVPRRPRGATCHLHSSNISQNAFILYS